MSLVRIRFNDEERVLAAGLRVRSLLSHDQAAQVQSGELVVLAEWWRRRGSVSYATDGRIAEARP